MTYLKHFSALGLALCVLGTLIATSRALGDAAQKPLMLPPETLGNEHSFASQLNFSSSAPHLFASSAGLLQQWANTVFPNGHAVAAASIPAFTLFFHGRQDADPPPSPEWLAFDQEMSYGIMGSTASSFLLTYQTTRPVKALYFDGESAALMGLGQLDSQMLVLFGNISGPPPPDGGSFFRGLWPEYERALGLCDWLEAKGLRGPGWGFEGVVRMNAGFEMIWCDFNSPSLRLLTHLNVSAPPMTDEESDDDINKGRRPGRPAPVADMDESELGMGELKKRSPVTSHYSLPPVPTRTDRAVEPSRPPAPPNWRRDSSHEPFLAAQSWGWFDSATWHYGSSRNGPGLGEVRARALSCGILSFYSPQFVNQSRNRALDEHRELNLTVDGLWRGEGKGGNRTIAIKELARRRRYHHLGDVNLDEVVLMRANAERALRNLIEPYNDCSGADWVMINTEIIQRTKLQLKMLEAKLATVPADTTNRTVLRDWLLDLRSHSHLFMVTYLEYPSVTDASVWDTKGALFNVTYSRCRYRYTRLFAVEEGDALLPEERDLKWAVEEVQGSICSVLLSTGFGIEMLWFELFTNPPQDSPDNTEREKIAESAKTQAKVWKDDLDMLTAWLGWENEFIGCKKNCAWDERCYIPMWPMIAFRGGFGRGPPGGGPRNGTRPGPGRPRGPGGPGGPGGPEPPYPYYGWPGLPRNETRPGGPGFGGPPRGRSWMGDETDLWEPKCVKTSLFGGR